MIRTISFCLFLCLLACPMLGQQLKVTEDSQNVVASAIEGTWESESGKLLSFRKDAEVLKELETKVKYAEFLKGRTIWFAGRMDFALTDDVKFKDRVCILVTERGNPMLFWFRERDGDPLGDSESFILFIARGENQAEDLLFQGGDFNNQGFKPYKRVE